MMKKFLVLVITIVMAMAMLTACGVSQLGDTDTTAVTTANNPLVSSFEEEDLISAYCEGTWDGSFVSNTEHCASIEDGVLWIDCQSTYSVPDMGPYEDSLWIEVIESSEEGTWIYDSDIGVVEHWDLGFRKQKFEIGTENAYYTYLYKREDCIVARYGSTLQVYNLRGGTEDFCLEDVVDVYETEEGILCSTFEHKNYLIKSSENIELLDSDHVRFERPMGTLAHSDEVVLTQAFNLYYAESWDGNCRRLEDGNFIAVDYNGDIIVNNQLVGNVCLGDSVVTADGPNIYLDTDRSYYLNGTHLEYFQHGPTDRVVDVPDGTAKFLWVNENDDGEVTVAAQAGDTVYIVYNDCTVKVIAEGVVDARVAYDILYYMVGDVVYSLDWHNPAATPEVFFEGAYAVSPHTDETEGAIVPQEYANYEGYGYFNLYSPYGRNSAD